MEQQQIERLAQECGIPLRESDPGFPGERLTWLDGEREPDSLFRFAAAIRAAALEEAATMADAQAAVYRQKRDAAPMDSETWERCEAMRDAAEHIAGSIRDLSQPIG